VLVAIDIGGTFTDLMAFEPGANRLVQAKSLTTPRDLVQGILDCLTKSGLHVGGIEQLIHGTTVAINTLVEQKGARTALIVTRGTRDVYIIGRGNRPEAYNFFFHRPKPLVPRHMTFEVNERMFASGEVCEALDRGDVDRLSAKLAELGVESAAVCLLHSYANPDHESMVGARLKEKLPNAFITTSHEILREYREYERISTTVVNAYIGPTVGGYIKQLGARLTGAGFTGELSIMQSNGGVMHPDTAALRPVTMMESGPVGGIIASARIGAALGYPSTIAFDMGGTTAKASLIYDAAPTMAEGYYVGGYANGHPVMTPVIDVVEVGTGGGSIAWIDEVGALKVGPRSAGAEPGPICYRRGGTDPTITDANVVLGRIGAEQFLGGEMKLDAAGAAVGLEKIGKPLGLDAVATARAVVDIAVAKMSLAVREVSVAKGFDPREFALVASGGAGPLHVIAVARELHVPTVIVPCFPAHFSALGMLMADERHDLVRTHFSLLSAVDFAQVRGMRAELVREAKAKLRNGAKAEYQTLLDLRYIGQEFALAVPVTDAQLDGDHAGIRKAFDEMHEQRYAHHAKDEPVEMIAIRLVATGARPKLAMPPVNGKRAAPKPVTRKVYLGGTAAVDCPVYQRDDLAAGFAFNGPALVQEYASTTVMLAGDSAKIADTGEIVISVGAG